MIKQKKYLWFFVYGTMWVGEGEGQNGARQSEIWNIKGKPIEIGKPQKRFFLVAWIEIYDYQSKVSMVKCQIFKMYFFQSSTVFKSN